MCTELIVSTIILSHFLRHVVSYVTSILAQKIFHSLLFYYFIPGLHFLSGKAFLAALGRVKEMTEIFVSEIIGLRDEMIVIICLSFCLNYL